MAQKQGEGMSMTAEEAYQKEIHEGRLMIKMHQELESLRQENSRLREALGEIVERYRIALPAPALVDDMQRIARQALNPPKRS